MMMTMMSVTFAQKARPSAIPVRQVLPWAIFGGLLLMLAIYFVGAEEGATSLIKGMYIHEFVHDGRHLLGYRLTTFLGIRTNDQLTHIRNVQGHGNVTNIVGVLGAWTTRRPTFVLFTILHQHLHT
jgi:hypothetical protein